MAEIRKKVLREYFEKILSGKKNFEVRIADFDCKEGDVLILEEIDDKREYTGRKIEKTIKYVAKTKNFKFFKQEDIDKYGFQVMGFD